MEAEDKDFADLAICESLYQLSEIKNAEVIAVYSAMEREANLNKFVCEALKKGKRVSFPRFLNQENDGLQYEMAEITDLNNLKIGKYGIPEPGEKCQACKIKEIDIWLVPGVAFATDGTRLGRGGGIYDRLLQYAVGKKIGVLYHCQLEKWLPCESHDIKMDMLITEEQVLTI